MRMFRIFGILLAAILILTGCSNEKIVYSDTYVFGQDAQISYIADDDEKCIAETGQGYYFMSGPRNAFLYFYDKDKQEAFPVCNKPDCLHVDEPDSSRIARCDSFLGLGVSNLKYYKGFLYYIAYEGINDGAKTLNRVSLDGSGHKRILTFKEPVVYMQIHRGYAYYSTLEAAAGGAGMDERRFQLMRIRLDNPAGKAETIYDDQQIMGQIGDIVCYGNYVYFYVSYNNADMSERVGFFYRYDIRTKTTEKFIQADVHLTVFNGKLIYMVRKDGTYACDMDGKNPMKITDAYGSYSANENFLFIDNGTLGDVVGGKIERSLFIIDKNWQTVKTVSLAGLQRFPMGCSNEYYFIPQVNGSSEFGETVTLLAVPVKQITEDMSPEVFHEFVPTVPFRGITWN